MIPIKEMTERKNVEVAWIKNIEVAWFSDSISDTLSDSEDKEVEGGDDGDEEENVIESWEDGKECETSDSRDSVMKEKGEDESDPPWEPHHEDDWHGLASCHWEGPWPALAGREDAPGAQAEPHLPAGWEGVVVQTMSRQQLRKDCGQPAFKGHMSAWGQGRSSTFLSIICLMPQKLAICILNICSYVSRHQIGKIRIGIGYIFWMILNTLEGVRVEVWQCKIWTGNDKCKILIPVKPWLTATRPEVFSWPQIR